MAPRPGYVEALWVGTEAVLPNGKILIPGETTHEITEGEAHQSDNWQPLTKQKQQRAPEPAPKADDDGGAE